MHDWCLQLRDAMACRFYTQISNHPRRLHIVLLHILLMAPCVTKHWSRSAYQISSHHCTGSSCGKRLLCTHLPHTLALLSCHPLQGGLASRPLLSVPHILADEASCEYWLMSRHVSYFMCHVSCHVSCEPWLMRRHVSTGHMQRSP
jgi:hypothetical protein